MNEIKEIEIKIKEKKDELSILENKLQKLKDNIEMPNLIGKYICTLSNEAYSIYMKVDNITKTQNLGWLIEGKSIEVTTQLIRTSYTIKTWGCYSISSVDDLNFIIDENEFNEIYKNAVETFNK